jgi:penicillin-binding protein 2
VALAAIDAGIATPDYHVSCSGVFNFGGHAFHCWQHRGHGTLDVVGGIEHSCDVFFYETARRVGIDRIEQAARKLGLGALTGIELPGEHSGLVPSRAWKEKTYKSTWQQGDTLSVGIGQGYVTVTPLQMCQQVARIASGTAVSPRMVHSVGARLMPRAQAAKLDFSDDALEKVRLGMNKVMNEAGGTAYAQRITIPGLEMAGKTGTAQVRVYTQEEHLHGMAKNVSLEWKMRDHGLFIGFGPVSDPKYAIVCVVEHNAEGHPQVVAARDVMQFTMQRDPLKLPVAYPAVNSASTAPLKQRADSKADLRLQVAKAGG